MYVEPEGIDLPAVRAVSAAGIALHPVPEGSLRKVLDLVTPQSVVAVAAIPEASLRIVMESAVQLQVPVLVLVELQDPGNVGTLVRIAEAAGCAGVIITERSVDLFNPKTVRATAGSIFRLPVVQGADIHEVLELCRSAGVTTLATVASGIAAAGGAATVDDAPLSGSVAILLGSEAHGLSEDVIQGCDGGVSIPMDGEVESLNAAVAGAVVAFEAARQRRVLVRSLGDSAADTSHNV